MKELREKIKAAATEKEGKQVLPCPKAFALAKELDASLKDIGQICDEENIRICNCQLGCF